MKDLCARHVPCTPLRPAQGGFALIMALAMLAIATLLAISGMRTGNIQLLMAGNLQEQIQAAVDAENAVIAAQNFIRDNLDRNNPLKAAAGNGYYVYDTTTGLSGAESLLSDIYAEKIWTSAAYTKRAPAPSGADPEEDPYPDNYIIEYLGTRAAAGVAQKFGSEGMEPKRNLYRITARGTRSRGALQVVQVLHVTQKDPPGP